METNEIYCGNAKEVMHYYFPSESVDLIYVDPPFFSNKNYELIWGNGYELKAYEDRWKGGMENYIAWMKPIMNQCHRVLKATGTFWLHCDWHAVHYLKVLLDEVFEQNNFRNEVIWNHQILGASHGKAFPKAHEHILRYSKSKSFTFNEANPSVRMPFSESIVKSLKEDEKGLYYTRGRMTRKATAEEVARGAGTKTYVNLQKGKLIGDVWSDLKSYRPTGRERLGYPTQKREALLTRIIDVSSNPGDLVLDPMCGGGTTMAVAQRLGRKWVGIDVSPLAVKTSETRLRRQDVIPRLIGMPLSAKALRALPPFAFQTWVIEKLYGHASAKMIGDKGIDGSFPDGVPIQVKQSEGIGRNVVDNFETAIRRSKQTKGTIVAFSFGKGAYEEVARAKNKDEIEITLLTVKEILERMGAHDKELEALEWSAEHTE